MVKGLTHRQRITRILQGDDVDRPAVAAWSHFYEYETSAEGLAHSMLRFQKEYDWDFMKINPRASYYVEDWGVRVAYELGPNRKPVVKTVPVKTSEDWLRLRPLDVTAGAYGEQLRAVELIARELDQQLDFVQTVFSPLSIAADLVGDDRRFIELLDSGQHLEKALEAITHTLVGYVARLLQLGVTGIFFATTEWATRDNLSEEQYLRLGKPYDLQVAEAAAGARFNILHVCKGNNMLPLFKHYPFHILSWNKFEPGNLDFAQADKIFNQVFLGGIDHIGTLVNGQPDDVITQAKTSLEEAAGHPLILGPGCAIKVETPESNLRALRESVG